MQAISHERGIDAGDASPSMHLFGRADVFAPPTQLGLLRVPQVLRHALRSVRSHFGRDVDCVAEMADGVAGC